MQMMTPQDDESFAIRYVDLLRRSQFEQVEDRFEPSIRDGDTRNTLAEMAGVFPTGEPASIKTVDVRVVHSRDSSTTNITLEYEFAPAAVPTSGTTELAPRSWLLAQVLIQKRGDTETIGGFHVTSISKPIEAINEFTFSDKGISQDAALGLTIFVSLFTLDTFVMCVRTKMGKKKWFWLNLIAIGVFRFTVNWTTGEWFCTPLTVQAPPVTWFCTAYGPWMVQATIPVGAIAFLLWRKKLTPGVSSLPLQSPTQGQ